MNFACFPAIRTVIFSVGAKPDTVESLAIATVAVAGALLFRFVALRTQDYGFHLYFSLAQPRRA
jgi:hypothetical protein